MSARRFVLLSMLAGCVLLATGCRSLAGTGCLKLPDASDVGERPLLMVPVGLDPADSAAVLKVPPPVATVPPPLEGACLESPPKVEKLADAVADEKAQKKRDSKEHRGTVNKTRGPHLQ